MGLDDGRITTPPTTRIERARARRESPGGAERGRLVTVHRQLLRHRMAERQNTPSHEAKTDKKVSRRWKFGWLLHPYFDRNVCVSTYVFCTPPLGKLVVSATDGPLNKRVS